MFEVARALIVNWAAFAQTEPTSGTGTGTGTGPSLQPMLLMMVAVFGFMYFFMMRPQQKREKERQQMLSGLSKGDKVVTVGGICGTIVGLNDKIVVLRICDEPGVKVECLRSSVSRVSGQEGKDS